MTHPTQVDRKSDRELVGTRNTKPPLLIWQAIVASGWGSNWLSYAAPPAT